MYYITSGAPQYFDAFYMFLYSEHSLSLNGNLDANIHLGQNPEINPAAKTGAYILYNTEQLTRTNQLERLKYDLDTYPPLELWDYSEANCAILRSHGITAVHVPLRTPWFYLERCLAWRHQGNTHDVGFCGTMSMRRQAILDELRSQGLSVLCCTTSGSARDRELARCKILLNIHYAEDYGIFESSRCELWLSAGIPVVSELSLDDDPRCIAVPYANIVTTVLKLTSELP